MHCQSILQHQLVAQIPPASIDRLIAVWFHHHLNPMMANGMEGLSAPGSPICIGVVTGLLVAYLIYSRSWYALLNLLLAVPCGTMLGEGIKLLVQRPRPYIAGPFGVWGGYSFPSGHALGATLLYGFVAWGLSSVFGASRWRWLPWAAVPVILGVGLSRIALGAHYLSDVVGGMSLGIVWLALCAIAVALARRKSVTNRCGLPAFDAMETAMADATAQ